MMTLAAQRVVKAQKVLGVQVGDIIFYDTGGDSPFVNIFFSVTDIVKNSSTSEATYSADYAIYTTH
ncbi:hypothetical protein OROGR_025322 [Orobanche gracilis]